jgi:hypothetical protein
MIPLVRNAPVLIKIVASPYSRTAICLKDPRDKKPKESKKTAPKARPGNAEGSGRSKGSKDEAPAPAAPKKK